MKCHHKFCAEGYSAATQCNYDIVWLDPLVDYNLTKGYTTDYMYIHNVQPHTQCTTEHTVVGKN